MFAEAIRVQEGGSVATALFDTSVVALTPQFTGFQDWPSLGVDAQIVASVQDPAWFVVVPLCELLDPVEEEAIRRRLGPDPLGNGARSKNLTEFANNLSRRKIPIGAALLDQRAIAGIGNIYRAETLFRTGIDPHVPAGQLLGDAVEKLWSECAALLRRGEKAGRIITVDLADVGAQRRRDLSREERVYVYKRHGEPCRRCETPIALTEMANRSLWWCPTCQPSGSGS